MIEALLDVWKDVGRGSEKLMMVVRGQEAMKSLTSDHSNMILRSSARVAINVRLK